MKKVVSRYCDTCGLKIPEEDFKSKKALALEGKYYCKDCKEEIIPLIKAQKRKKKKTLKEGKKKKKSSLKKEAKKKKEKGKKKEKKEREKEPQKRQPLSPLWIAAGGGALVLLLIGIFFAFQGESREEKKPSKEEVAKREKQWLEEWESEVAKLSLPYEKLFRKWEVLMRLLQVKSLKEKARERYRQVLERYRKEVLESLEKALSEGNWEVALAIYLEHSHRLRLSQEKKEEIRAKLASLETKLFSLGAEKVAPKLIERAKQLFDEGKEREAVALLCAFDRKLYGETLWAKRVESTMTSLWERMMEEAQRQRLEKILREKYRATMAEVERLIKEKRFAEAKKLLQDFAVQNPQFRDKVQQKLKEIRKKEQEAFEALLAKYEWIDLIADGQTNLLNWTFTNYQKIPGKKGFSISNGVMQVENDYGQPIFLATGAINWKDYLIEYEARPVRGKIVLLVRYYRRGRSRQVFFTFLEAPETPSRWYKIQWLIQGRRYLYRLWRGNEWSDWKAVRVLQSRPYSMGAVGFLAMPGHSFKVRRMRIKVFSKGRAF